jgi:hypothetical protein
LRRCAAAGLILVTRSPFEVHPTSNWRAHDRYEWELKGNFTAAERSYRAATAGAIQENQQAGIEIAGIQDRIETAAGDFFRVGGTLGQIWARMIAVVVRVRTGSAMAVHADCASKGSSSPLTSSARNSS